MVLASGDPRVDLALSTAALVICATTARAPLFDSRLLVADTVVIAVGSHDPSARELDGSLLSRADIVVEDVNTSLREAGDVVLAIDEGALDVQRLTTMSAAVRTSPRPHRATPLVFKTTGMPWEDLVVASAIYTAWLTCAR